MHYEECDKEQEELTPKKSPPKFNYDISISITSNNRIGYMLENLFIGVLGMLKEAGFEVIWFMKVHAKYK